LEGVSGFETGVAFDAIAVTRGFRGSPHVDARDTSHQYVLALGEFRGGRLCVEECAEEGTSAGLGKGRVLGNCVLGNCVLGDGDAHEDASRKPKPGPKNLRLVPTGSVLRVDVHEKIGRIDGRHVHWVDGWEGERFSVVYFCMTKANATTRLPTEAHERWMTETNERVDRRASATPSVRA
jgi:hypothetical protein